MQSSRRLVKTSFMGLCIALLLARFGASSQEDLERKMNEAVQFYRTGVFSQAIAKLQEVITLLEQSTQREAAKPKLVTANFYMGMSFAALGDDTLARERFKSVLRLDPRHRLDPATYAPRIIQLFEEARSELSAERKPGAPPPRAQAAPAPSEPRTSGSKLPYVLAGAGGAGAVGAALALREGEPDAPAIDNDGDGFTQNQGDCNDADRQVNPSATFDFMIDFAFTGTLDCSIRNARQQVYTIRNLSCSTLSVTAITRSWSVTAPCSGGDTTSLPLTGATSIPPGQSAVIRRGADAGRSAPFCCDRPPCPRGDDCRVSETYAASTNLGMKSVGNSFTVEDVEDCPRCTEVVPYSLRDLPPDPSQSTSPADDSVSGESTEPYGGLLWTSELSASHASGQVVLNHQVISAVSAGRFQGTAHGAPNREYFIEAQLLQSSEAGTWRLEFSGLRGFEPDWIEIVEGQALEVSPASVLFKLKGQPGERVVVRLRGR